MGKNDDQSNVRDDAYNEQAGIFDESSQGGHIFINSPEKKRCGAEVEERIDFAQIPIVTECHYADGTHNYFSNQ